MQTLQTNTINAAAKIKKSEVNGTNLAYIEQGAGEPVIFVHGAVSDYRTWLEQIGAFSENFRTICYSRRFPPAE